MDEFAVVTHQHDALGEGPLWVASEDALYWVDILGRRMHRYRVSTGVVTTWAMPEPLCWIVERCDPPAFIAGFAAGFAPLSIDPLEIGPIRALEPDMANHRLNDAKVDQQGRLWAGTMHRTAGTPCGSFYRIEGDAAPARVDRDYCVPNGPAFSLLGDYLYHADSLRRTVYRFVVAPDGTLHDKRDHIRFDDEWGLPDGMTIDAAGYLWVAHWDGSRISRFDPDGCLDRAIKLPASRITSCAFGGAELDRLFVTSSRAEREGEPLAGALFEIDAGTTGIASYKYAG